MAEFLLRSGRPRILVMAAGASYTLKYTIILGLFDRTVELFDHNSSLLNERVPGSKDWEGQGLTPLHVALGGGWLRELWFQAERNFKLLLDRGAEMHTTDGLGRTPLHIAIEKPDH